VADALINGKAINIEGGNYRLVMDRRLFLCQDCNSQWEAPQQSGRPSECPSCRGQNFYRFVDRQRGDET
jgi:Zn finger protein HypA/HybF involved in hydrogenase expression